MKFEYLRKTDKPVMEYRQMLSTGDVVDFDEHFSKKAMKRTQDFRLIQEVPAIESGEPVVKVKRKYTRKAKNDDQSGSP